MKVLELFFIVAMLIAASGCNEDKFINDGDIILDGIEEIEPDLLYQYPYNPVTVDDDILISTIDALYTSSIVVDENKNLILKSPNGWGILHNSISPDHKRILLTMMKPICPTWPNEDGLNCGYGRLVLWMAYHEPNSPNDFQDDKWILKNLSTLYGQNANIHGWTSWQSNKHALFNGLIRPINEPVLGNSPRDNNAQAYQIQFNSNTDINIDFWGQNEIYDPDCLIGRVYSSNPEGQVVENQKVIFARRCYDEPISTEAHAWWNTKNSDGNGGKCVNEWPSIQVPVLRLYIVETDLNGQPKTTSKLVKQPNNGPYFRQMNKTPEWGEMQPVISKNGRFVAFHTVRGFDFMDENDNCAALNFGEHSSSVVNYCELDDNLECMEIKQFPLPEELPVGQGQPFFVEKDGNTFLIITEDDHSGQGNYGVMINLSDPETRINRFDGFGGYPL